MYSKLCHLVNVNKKNYLTIIFLNIFFHFFFPLGGMFSFSLETKTHNLDYKKKKNDSPLHSNLNQNLGGKNWLAWGKNSIHNHFLSTLFSLQTK